MGAVHTALVMTAALAAACASANVAPAPEGARQTVRVDAPTGSIELSASNTPSVAVGKVAAPIERVWALLPAVYDSLGIPVGMANSTTHIIGNNAFKIRQRLGKAYLSKYIDCGESQIGESADSYDVVMTIYTQLVAVDAATTQVSTSLEAAARPPAFSQSYSRCSSKSALEATVLKVLKARLGA